VSGFQGAPWAELAKLEPQLVLLPWTERPDAHLDAKAAPSGRAGALGLSSRLHVRSLNAMYETAAAVLAEVARKGPRRKAGDGDDEHAQGLDDELELGAMPFG